MNFPFDVIKGFTLHADHFTWRSSSYGYDLIKRIWFENVRFNGSHTVHLKAFDEMGKVILKVRTPFVLFSAKHVNTRLIQSYAFIANITLNQRFNFLLEKLMASGSIRFEDGILFKDGTVSTLRGKPRICLAKAFAMGTLVRGYQTKTRALRAQRYGEFWISDTGCEKRYTGLSRVFNSSEDRVVKLSDLLDGDLMQILFDVFIKQEPGEQGGAVDWHSAGA